MIVPDKLKALLRRPKSTTENVAERVEVVSPIGAGNHDPTYLLEETLEGRERSSVNRVRHRTLDVATNALETTNRSFVDLARVKKHGEASPRRGRLAIPANVVPRRTLRDLLEASTAGSLSSRSREIPIRVGRVRSSAHALAGHRTLHR